jgi:hypothetical protein
MVATGWRRLTARLEVSITAMRHLLHGRGLLRDLLAQRGQPGVLVAKPEQPEQEASRQQNDSRKHGEQENHHQVSTPVSKVSAGRTLSTIATTVLIVELARATVGAAGLVGES